MRQGRNYIETLSGKRIFLPNADHDQICIYDIAHALSLVTRFAGHIDQFYSVAEHSIHVCSLVPEVNMLQALLHDATEAYLCDIPTPFKRMLPEYSALEENLWKTISERYNVPFELAPSVKEADRIMLMTERDALKSKSNRDWAPEYEETLRWKDWAPLGKTQKQIAQEFVALFFVLGGKN